MNTIVKLKAQQVRQDYLKQRAQRNSTIADVGVPTVVDAIVDDADGLLPVSALVNPIRVTIPNWGSLPNDPLFEEILELQWKVEGEPDSQYISLVTEVLMPPIIEPFPLQRVIPASFFNGREAKFLFRIGVKSWSDTTIAYSAPVPITLDRTPPYGTTTPLAVEEVPLVNDASLTANGGVLVTIPDFTEEKKEFVVVAIVWADKPPEANVPIVPSVTQLLPATRQVLIPRSVVEALASGEHYVAYDLFDKAGNRSRTSSIRTVPVVLGPLPELLKPPFVPLAEDDGLIDLEDAQTGVTVEVPAYVNWLLGDKVVVTWGNSELEGVFVGARPPFPDPIEVPVTWPHLKAEYTADPDTQTTPVTYSIVRGTTPFPLPEADGIEVEVNFAHPGPTNPDDPSPVNPVLDKVLVKGNSGTDNHLIETDTGLPAIATFILYDPPVAGDFITLFWNGVAVAETVTLDGTESVGDPIEINVLWSEIETGGPSDEVGLPVYYTLSNPDFFNDQRSQSTHVVVEAVPIILPVAEYRDLAPIGPGILNCSSLREKTGGLIGYRVHVPASRYLIAGESIVMTWQLKAEDVLVPGSEKTETIPIAVDADINGIEWFVQPYALHIEPAYTETVFRWAYAETSYTLLINAVEVSSVPTVVIVGIQNLEPGHDTCDLTIVTPHP